MKRYVRWRSAPVWAFLAYAAVSGSALAADIATGDDGNAVSCCAVPEKVAAADSGEVSALVWAGASLRNRLDPFTGEETSQGFFATYADDGNKVFARIYFASAENAKRAEAAA